MDAFQTVLGLKLLNMKVAYRTRFEGASTLKALLP
jgi:hypothetical protein